MLDVVITAMLSSDLQTMVFSVTMPKAMTGLFRQYPDEPIRIEVSPPGKVTRSVRFFPKDRKQDLLTDLPNLTENYVHRIGGTARTGQSGCEITILAADEAAAPTLGGLSGTNGCVISGPGHLAQYD